MEANKMNLIAVGTKFDGTVEFRDYTRFEGFVSGTLKGAPGSEIIIGENGVVEGKIDGDTVVIDGFVRGDVIAKTKVAVSGTGRVIGEIRAPSVTISFGAHFEGKCLMQGPVPQPA